MIASYAKSIALAVAVLGFGASTVVADTIQLVNGDAVSGKVLSFDDDEVKLESSVLGLLTIPRGKISSIQFGDAPAPAAKPAQSVVPQLPAITAEQKKYLEQQQSKNGPSVEDALRQLRTDGVNNSAIEEIGRNLPGFAAPEVQDYFNNTVGGLRSGKLNIDDIRKDAIRARDQLKELQEDLGPEAAALNGYLGILENFIRKTEPEKTSAAKDPAKPTAPKK